MRLGCRFMSWQLSGNKKTDSTCTMDNKENLTN